MSRDHHDALLLCFKIKTGLGKGVATDRIKKYADWFYIHHLLPHFALEEKYMFPILGNEHPMIVQALRDHKLLEKLFTDTVHPAESLKQITTVLNDHVRFEERILFPEIEKAATTDQLQIIAQMHAPESCVDNESDVFWK